MFGAPCTTGVDCVSAIAVSDGETWSRSWSFVIPNVSDEAPGESSPRYAIAFESWIAVRALSEGIWVRDTNLIVKFPAFEPA